ncbi:MAG: butyrate kinase [Candidatus Neomarinimicrobiota bacterium]|nr:MAG: butyrate kinase [Candidatus Neomarinimicrobiota bacterium]
MKKEVVLAVNPGSTSTKLALFTREGSVYEKNIDHTGTAICNMHSISEQLPLRLEIVNNTYKPLVKDYKPVAVVGRGGLVKPIISGIYIVNDAFMKDTISCKYATHASNLGASIAYGIAKDLSVPAYVVDPVTVDEFIPEARISGVPEIQRRSRLHTLNVNACVRKEAKKLGKKIKDIRFVVVHLGGGITVAAIDGGKIIDCNDALVGMGPFSPERAGALPLEGVVKMAMSGDYTFKELYKKFSKNSGLKAYLGTSDVREVLHRIENGDEEADLIFRAMIYQICKEIGAMATVLKGKLDRIIVTGGMAHSPTVVRRIKERVGFLASISVYPGENELESLAAAGFRAIDGEQEVLIYESD